MQPKVSKGIRTLNNCSALVDLLLSLYCFHFTDRDRIPNIHTGTIQMFKTKALLIDKFYNLPRSLDQRSQYQSIADRK